MSWFGETFGDSLNSIKGQITKITKEVLAEDDNEKEEETESIKSKLKELDALCSSKDLEIASLRDENKKLLQRFQEELKFLKSENKKLKSDSNGTNENILLGDDQMQQVCELQNELHQLRIERDHLEELQKDHLSNICLVMQQRDGCKSDLEKLKAEYSNLESKYNDLLNQQSNSKEANTLSDVNLLEIQIKDDELASLRNITEKLQSQIETYEQEKNEASKLIEKVTLENETLKEKIEKLMEEIKTVNSEKESLESENCRLKETIHAMKSDLNKKNDEFESEKKKEQELEEQLRKLTITMESGKVEQSNLKQDLENQVNKLLKIFLINNTENISLSNSINEIENFWKKNLKEKENMEKMHNENINKLQSEIQRLKNDKMSLEHEIKIGIDKRNKLECDYEKEINSLQNKYLKLKSKEQDCLIKSQTDDVKRLDQEVTRLTDMVEKKNDELRDCYNKMTTIVQEFNAVKSQTVNCQQELLEATAQKNELENSVLDLKINLEKKEKEILEMIDNEERLKETCKEYEEEKTKLLQQSESLRSELEESLKANEDLENKLMSLNGATDRTVILERELEETARSKGELEKICADMQKRMLDLSNQSENLKAELGIRENSVAELNAKNQGLTEEVTKLKEDSVKLRNTEEELHKWKETMVDLEIQRQELSEQKEFLEKECAALGSQLIAEKEKGAELEDVKRENARLIAVCNELQNERQSKYKNEKIDKEMNEARNLETVSALQAEIQNLRAFTQQQGNIIASLSYENKMKQNFQLTSENLSGEENQQLKQIMDSTPHIAEKSFSLESEVSRDKLNVVQQHRRSKSDFDAANAEDVDVNKLRLEVESLKESLRHQQKEFRQLQEQYALVSESEAHSRKELERLKLHLVEVENYYTETVDEYKTKLNVTEEQLKNSSTVYTSTKVRDNQHLESLQSQIRLISAQRDDLQVKLSAAEDEVQKHKAALTSFHVVLEQFQQDKERDLESLSAKYGQQIMISQRRFAELQQEITSLNNQLSEAKTGLKAASRLGEQLERKSIQIAEMERSLAETKNEMKELEERASLANQSSIGKVDKSLVKNLVLGFISAQKADRKNQVLRILMSVLDFDEEERNKIGIDNSQSGWLSHLLHPRGDGTQTSQSLSEAFIRFLENESRPQPQIKLLPERNTPVDRPSASIRPQPSLLLQELVLPTFNSPQSSESTILKDVLNDT